jgi:hypothetical protein
VNELREPQRQVLVPDDDPLGDAQEHGREVPDGADPPRDEPVGEVLGGARRDRQDGDAHPQDLEHAPALLHRQDAVAVERRTGLGLVYVEHRGDLQAA